MDLSSEFQYQEVRNHVSMLLAELRPRISTRQFRLLLRLQLAADDWTRQRAYPLPFRRLWYVEASKRIQLLDREVRAGQVSGEGLKGLRHVLGHLFI